MSFSSDALGSDSGFAGGGRALPRRRGRPLEMPPDQVLDRIRELGRGRPLEMPPDQVLDRIRELGRQDRLFRVHRDQPGLYARARRLFGSWSAAVQAAGFDYRDAIENARRRSVETRRRQRSSGPDASL